MTLLLKHAKIKLEESITLENLKTLKPLISLDIFDTSIFRNVFYPEDIFAIVEDKVGNDFKKIRKEAQRKAALKNFNYNIVDVYNNMPLKFNPKEEILTEMLECKPNPYILSLYNTGSENYDFIFISDMYLPSSVLVKMLEKCGYKNPQVFVSCEEKALKSSGELFRIVEEKLGRKIEKHIGDNYYADIKGAKKAGIPEVEFIGPPVYTKQVVTPDLENLKLRKLLIDKELSKDSIESKIGYLFGPLIWLFLKNILNELEDNQTAFFNARDGFILYVIARWVLKTNKRIKYCRFSRKSAHLPNLNTNFALTHPNNALSLGFFKTSRVRNLREFIKVYELDESVDYSKALNEIRDYLKLPYFDLDTRIDFLPERPNIIGKFMGAVQDQFFKRALKERLNFLKYISKLGMKNGDLFIDLGHFGTMQSVIGKISKVLLKGRYIHMYKVPREIHGVDVEKTSFLPKGFLKLYTGIVELVLTEPKGTSIFYSDKGTPICDIDIKYRKDITKKILRGIIDCVKDIKNNDIDVLYDDSLKILERFLTTPTVEEASFGNQELFENGSGENRESIVWYSEEWIRKGKVKECYNRSYWKSAFKVLMENDPKFRFLLKEIK